MLTSGHIDSFVTAEDRKRAQGMLGAGEELLWCGKPEPSGLTGKALLYFFPGCACLLLCCVGVGILRHELFEYPVVLIGLGYFLLMGLVLCVLPPLVRRRCMRRWLYVLTDRRAMALLHDGVREWALAPHMVKEYRPGSIVFGYEKNALLSNKPWLLEEGFLRCREAGVALELLERLLSGRARPEMVSPEALAHAVRVNDEARALRLAASRGVLVMLGVRMLLALGGLCSAPWWLGRLDFPLNAVALILAHVLLLITLAELRTYRRGRKLLARRCP